MDKNLDYPLLVLKYSADTNKQVTDKLKQDHDELNKKQNKHDFEFYKIKTFLNKFLVKNQTSSQ